MSCEHGLLWEFLGPASVAVLAGDFDMARARCECGAALLVGFCQSRGVQAELTEQIGGELVTRPIDVEGAFLASSPAAAWAPVAPARVVPVRRRHRRAAGRRRRG